MDSFDLQKYLTEGVERTVKDALRASAGNPRETAFMLRFAAASAAASKRREKAEKNGDHVPPFLIASITSSCNLHCAGCYSRCTGATTDETPVKQLTGEEWGRIFPEADELGISFILLAGGEPLLRRDVIEAAGERQNILFPVFTNGTYIDQYLPIFDRRRNLLPVISVEGGKEATDKRRGDGVYDKLISGVGAMKEKSIIFGASVTVTTENLGEVTSDGFIGPLADLGCRVVFLVEYVPMDGEDEDLAPGDAEREKIKAAVSRLRERYPTTLFITFPGDEKDSEGCIAAGRGFFHINSHGGAEPCPFSPYSDISVRDLPLKEALRSPLFTAIRGEGLLSGEHVGGCALYERRAEVERILAAEGR
ncbi:MAG: radical SAM protein [Clostridia bacterium]|nr:radical SAM protein [Clostridia bacterium]